jgi:hypothetical protein
VKSTNIIYSFVQYLFPYNGWWVVPLKVAFDQTIWSAIWNSIYYVTLGLLRFESPTRIFKDLRATFFPLLTVCSPEHFCTCQFMSCPLECIQCFSFRVQRKNLVLAFLICENGYFLINMKIAWILDYMVELI